MYIYVTQCIGACTPLASCTHSRPHSFLQRRRARPERECRMWEFKLELQSGIAKFGSKSANFLSCVTLKFDRWLWKTIGHLPYATSSFVHHFIAMGLFKLELECGNAKFRSKSAIFCPVWPWNLTDDPEKHLFYAKLGVDLCDLDLWPLTLTLHGHHFCPW